MEQYVNSFVKPTSNQIKLLYMYMATFQARCLIYIFPLVALVLLQSCHGYPSGAPLDACQDMVPNHPPTTTSGNAPFEIKVSQTSYTPGEKITGTTFWF